MNSSVEFPRLTDIEVRFFKELKSVSPILYVWAVLGFLSLLADGVMLLLSKYTSGGKSPIFIFMRTLFVGDLFVGMFGIFKALLLYNMDKLTMDCFLPESLFVTGATSSLLTLLWLSVDSCMRLATPLKYILHMHKNNVVMWMVALWNVSFVVGFLPQMASTAQVCLFSQYYKLSYLIFIMTLWILVFTLCFIVQVCAKRLVHRIRINRHLLSPTSREVRRYRSINMTIRLELISWLACFVPIVILCIIGSYVTILNEESFNLYLIYALPIYILRSLIFSVIRGYRTVQIHRATQELRRQVTRIISRNTSNSLQKRISSLESSLRRKRHTQQNNIANISNNHNSSDHLPICINEDDTDLHEIGIENSALERDEVEDVYNVNESQSLRLATVHFNNHLSKPNIEITKL